MTTALATDDISAAFFLLMAIETGQDPAFYEMLYALTEAMS